MGEALKQLWQWWSSPVKPPVPAEGSYRVGEYYADYSPLTPEEMAAEDPAVKDLFEHSRPVSR